MNKVTRDHGEWLKEKLASDPEFMIEYLQAALEDSESKAEVLVALRAVVEAKGISTTAEKAGIQRESLSRALGPQGNPSFKTLSGILKAIGVKLSVTLDDHNHAHA